MLILTATDLNVPAHLEKAFQGLRDRMLESEKPEGDVATVFFNNALANAWRLFVSGRIMQHYAECAVTDLHPNHDALLHEMLNERQGYWQVLKFALTMLEKERKYLAREKRQRERTPRKRPVVVN